ncbi:MAG: hypothetical protein GY757_04520 [bacterium]|nr:hypothetical protein [bacterium]
MTNIDSKPLPSICLTGDVHHMGLKTRDQEYLEGTEMDSVFRFLEIAGEFGLKSTLFFTGKLFEEEQEKTGTLMTFKNLEIGGHNYYAFKPRLPFGIFKKLTGLKNGPRMYQNWEVAKTVKKINETTGIRIRSWRNHGYRHDRNTMEILVKNGIHYYSDQLAPGKIQPYKDKGITIFPINVLPDHDFIFHGHQTEATVNETVLRATPFACGAMNVNAWLNTVKRQVDSIIEKGGTATLLIHPACMDMIDRMESFKQLCLHLSQYKSCFMKDWDALFSSPPEKEVGV